MDRYQSLTEIIRFLKKRLRNVEIYSLDCSEEREYLLKDYSCKGKPDLIIIYEVKRKGKKIKHCIIAELKLHLTSGHREMSKFCGKISEKFSNVKNLRSILECNYLIKIVVLPSEKGYKKISLYLSKESIKVYDYRSLPEFSNRIRKLLRYKDLCED